MRKLIINGTIADLSEGSIIALSKEINDMWDFKDKRANLTNTFTLPFSATNNLIFKNANIVNITDTTIRNYYECYFIQDFVQIISYGKGKLISATNGYEFTITWGNIDLSETLGTKTLQDLELSDLNHIWNHTNVIALFCPAPAPNWEVLYSLYNPSGVNFDMFAKGTTPDPFFSQNFIPMVQMRRLINQIAIDNGLTFTGGIENTNTMAYVPVQFNDFNPDYNVEASFVQRNVTGTPDFTIGIGNWLDFVQITPDDIKLDKTGVMALGVFKSPETASYIFNLDLKYYLTFSKTYYQNNAKFSLDCKIYYQTSNDNINWTTVYTRVYDQIIVDELKFYNLNLSENNIRQSIPANTYFRFYAEIYGGGIDNINAVLFYNTPETVFSINTDKMVFGNTWNIARNLPLIKQIDLLKYACVLGGWIFSKTDNTNEIVFKRFSDICNNIQDAQDLSDYMESFTIENLHTELSQLNRLKYDNDETVKETTGEGLLLIADDTLNKEQDIYTAPFGASGMESYILPSGASIQVAKFPYLRDDLTWDKINPRIFNLQLETLNVYFRALSTTTLVQSKFVARFSASDLSFSNSLVKNYGNYIDIVNDFKLINGKFYMTAARFNDIDLLKPVFIKQLGSHFYIQKVKDFVLGQLCEILLIKI